MNKFLLLLFCSIFLFSCRYKDRPPVIVPESVKGIHIPNVGIFAIADSSLAAQIGNSDTVSESSLSSEQLGMLIPLQFDSVITALNIKNFTNYRQVVNELVARGRLRAYSMVGDTIVPKQPGEKILLFDKIPTATLVETRNLMAALEKAIYNDQSFPLSGVFDTAKTAFGESVLHMVSRSRLPATILTRKINTIRFDSKKLAVNKLFKICENARRWQYDDNIVFSECTAFAISDDLVVTAGHCLNERNFRNYLFMLGFTDDPVGSIAIDSANVYEPVEYIDGIADTDHGIDYALVRVHKKIPKEKILSCSLDTAFTGADKFYMAGHPMGTYTKISLDGSLLENANANYFVLSIDAFAGNSGSPVLNERENKVNGVLISGNADLIIDEDCKEFVFCAQNARCSGERVFRMASMFKRPKVKAYLAQHPLSGGSN